jgi:hypothetical protein
MSVFSGKLSPVMTHSEDSEQKDPSTAAPAPQSARLEIGESAPRQIGGSAPREVGGRDGLEPTRFGDWELRGRCIDF